MIIFCECMNDDLCQTSDYFHHILSSFIHKIFKLLPNLFFWVWFCYCSIYKFNLNVKYWIYKGFQISFCCIHQFLLNKKFLPMNPMWHPTKVCLLIILLNDTRNYVAIGLFIDFRFWSKQNPIDCTPSMWWWTCWKGVCPCYCSFVCCILGHLGCSKTLQK